MRARTSAIILFATAVLIMGCSSFGRAQSPGAKMPGKSARKAPPPEKGDVTIRVLAGGGFEPKNVSIHAGQKVTWVLDDPRRDSIVPIRSDAGADASCNDVAAYTGKADDFTGPMPRNPGGQFILNQDGPGLVAKGNTYVEEGELGAVTDASWASDSNTGAFLRLRWDWLQPTAEGQYDWTVLDREVEKAVANGKLYSIGVKAGFHGTPDWIFDAGVDKLIFREFGSGDKATDCKCGSFMALGNPTQDRYQELYFAMLEAVADHLKSNAAWYRHLAYVKPSGANLFSAENRLPKRCNCAKGCSGADRECPVPKAFRNAPNLSPDGRICNTKVWAEAGYTTQGLYQYYERQHKLIAKVFPEKDMAYLLIHDGFPRIGGPNRYLECRQDGKVRGLPDPTEQTREIIRRGYRNQGSRMALMHAGLSEERKMNRLLETERKPDQTLGLQTTNTITTAEKLRRTVTHALEKSEVTMLEVYEIGALDADTKTKFPDFNAQLQARRQQMTRGNGAMRETFPKKHEHMFTQKAAGETYRFVNPYRCKGAASVGTIHVVP